MSFIIYNTYDIVEKKLLQILYKLKIKDEYYTSLNEKEKKMRVDTLLSTQEEDKKKIEDEYYEYILNYASYYLKEDYYKELLNFIENYQYLFQSNLYKKLLADTIYQFILDASSSEKISIVYDPLKNKEYYEDSNKKLIDISVKDESYSCTLEIRECNDFEIAILDKDLKKLYELCKNKNGLNQAFIKGLRLPLPNNFNPNSFKNNDSERTPLELATDLLYHNSTTTTKETEKQIVICLLNAGASVTQRVLQHLYHPYTGLWFIRPPVSKEFFTHYRDNKTLFSEFFCVLRKQLMQSPILNLKTVIKNTREKLFDIYRDNYRNEVFITHYFPFVILPVLRTYYEIIQITQNLNSKLSKGDILRIFDYLELQDFSAEKHELNKYEINFNVNNDTQIIWGNLTKNAFNFISNENKNSSNKEDLEILTYLYDQKNDKEKVETVLANSGLDWSYCFEGFKPRYLKRVDSKGRNICGPIVIPIDPNSELTKNIHQDYKKYITKETNNDNHKKEKSNKKRCIIM